MSVERIEIAADKDTIAEWQSHFQVSDDPGLTAAELATIAGVSRSTMWDRLIKGMEAGTYTKGQARRLTRGGKRYVVTVFELVKPKKGKR